MGSARRFPLLLLLGLAGPAAALAGYIEVGPGGGGVGGGTGWGGGAPGVRGQRAAGAIFGLTGRAGGAPAPAARINAASRVEVVRGGKLLWELKLNIIYLHAAGGGEESRPFPKTWGLRSV